MSPRTLRPVGYTLVETLITLTVIALVLGAALPAIKHGFDRIATRGAASDAAAAFFVARASAVASARQTIVRIDTTGRISVLSSRGDTLMTRDLARLHRTAVAATRREMIYSTVGLGYAGANLRLVFTRGRAADTVVVSREGRVRRGR
ncbi:MAG TPA: hypothetical protein VHM67_15175 [Gemmatimonadaceae bacterium]|nr:hypothetical protein [Gemmatimonadaceae bacterium]